MPLRKLQVQTIVLGILLQLKLRSTRIDSVKGVTVRSLSRRPVHQCLVAWICLLWKPNFQGIYYDVLNHVRYVYIRENNYSSFWCLATDENLGVPRAAKCWMKYPMDSSGYAHKTPIQGRLGPLFGRNRLYWQTECVDDGQIQESCYKFQLEVPRLHRFGTPSKHSCGCLNPALAQLWTLRLCLGFA